VTEISFSTKSGKVVLDEKKNVRILQTLRKEAAPGVPEYMLTALQQLQSSFVLEYR